MKIWSVFSVVIIFHVAVIGVLLIQPGCQSQSSPAPDPSMTTAATGAPPPEPVANEPLDPAFNAGIEPVATAGSGRSLSAPRRPTGVTRTEPDTSALQPVLEPVQDDLSLPGIQTKYEVQKGDNLTVIARRNGISLSDLLSANGLTRSSTIYVGQELLIPASAPDETNGSLEVEHSGKQVVVVSGDTLGKIAARTGTTVQAIKRLNGLTSDTIYVGQKLALPESARVQSPAPAPSRSTVTSTASAGGQTYVVQAGDTPSGIARQFGISSSALMAANGITDPRRLYVGRSLVIPSAGSTAAAPVQSTQPVPSRTETVTTLPEPVPAEPSEDDPMSILEALEDEDLPYVEVEAVEETQPLN